MCIGVFVENTKKRVSYKLAMETSVTSAEVIAISIATQIIEEDQLQNYVIYTDSRSACLMLANAKESKSDEAILVDILDKCYKWKTSVQWIPSHVSISGNEIADQLAKAGVTSNVAVSHKIPLKDAFLNAKSSLERRTNQWYEAYSEEKGTKFYERHPKFYKAAWYKNVDMKGSNVKLINRLMTTHDYSKYWLHRMKISDDADCELCGEPETSEHLILHCPRFGRIRMQFSFDNKFLNLTELFKTGKLELLNEVAEFIRRTKLDL